jgi:Na+/melibiose symporter-like transporter
MLLSVVSLALTAAVVPETRRSDRENLSVSAALRLPELRRGGIFVALCAALQAALFFTLPVYLVGVLGWRVQATTALIAGLVAIAAAFQLVALPRLLKWLGPNATARVLVGVAVFAAALMALVGGSHAVLAAAATLATAAAALAPVSALLLAEGRPEAPMGLVMGLNASSATGGQIVGPLAGYAAFGVGGPRGVGVGCIALGLCAAFGLQGLEDG